MRSKRSDDTSATADEDVTPDVFEGGRFQNKDRVNPGVLKAWNLELNKAGSFQSKYSCSSHLLAACD